MSELLDKQVNAQKEKLRGFMQAHKKVYDEMKQTKKKQRARKNVMEGRKPFITPMQNIGENDLHELLGNNYGYNGGTICLVNG